MKKILVVLAVLLLVLASAACGKKTPEPSVSGQKLYHAEITVKGYGTVKLELDAETAPITVANFVSLAKQGFYDGLTFHRIIDTSLASFRWPEPTTRTAPAPSFSSW